MNLYTPLKAGAVYFAMVFGCGFLLGALRVVVMVPRVGEATAVMLELPVILTLSWLASRWLIAKLSVPRRLLPRLVMGGIAFGLTMLGEVGVSYFVLGHSVIEHIAGYRSWLALLGLFGQIVFGMLPTIQMLSEGDRLSRD